MEVTLAGRVSGLEVALRGRMGSGVPSIRPAPDVPWVQKAEGGDAPSDALCDSIGFALGVRSGLVREYLTGSVNALRVADDHADSAALFARGGFLGDAAILRAVQRHEIVVEPFSLSDLQANSYDVHLGSVLRVYRRGKQPLDARKPCEMADVEIGPRGRTLQPGKLYLGSTVERTESPRHLPFLNGKSSVGRLGIRVHATAGNGDVGFRGHFTLEIDVIEPVRVYAGMAIGQLVWSSVQGPVVRPYGSRKTSKYQNQGAAPVASRMHMNFPKVPRG